eukprot:1157361-Pelagomonas_calceolata.AAC.1
MSIRIGQKGNGRIGVQVKEKRHHKTVEKLQECKGKVSAYCLYALRLLEGDKGTGTRVPA